MILMFCPSCPTHSQHPIFYFDIEKEMVFYLLRTENRMGMEGKKCGATGFFFAGWKNQHIWDSPFSLNCVNSPYW